MKYGLGYFEISEHRKKENKKHYRDQQISEEEMMFYEKYKHGYIGFERQKEYCKKIFCWDLKTHPDRQRYLKLVGNDQNLRNEISLKWIDEMKQEDKWFSFYEWYFGKILKKLK